MQLSIPMPAQPRNRRYERASTWEVVMFLRRAQYTVRRQGRLHSVNGKRLTTYELKRLAGWVRGMAV
jgi:hypothetical protein